MNTTLRNTLALTAILTTVTSAHAFERETGGRMMPMKKMFSCFNRIQMTDGPMVSILGGDSGYRALEMSGRGGTKLVNLAYQGKDQNGSVYTNDTVTVRISADEQKATVQFNIMQVIYTCTRDVDSQK